MKQLLIIINPKNGAELSNVQRATIDYPGNQGSVLKISDTVFLIDPHKSLGTVSALIQNAFAYKVPVSVFEVEDALLLNPQGNQDRLSVSPNEI